MADPSGGAWAWIIENYEALLAIPVGIAISAGTSLITVRLSLGRFREEKWWEKRAQAYERVIEALHKAKAYAGARADEEVGGGSLSGEASETLVAGAIEARREIERAADLGGFLFDRKTHERLKDFLIEKEDALHSGDPMSSYEGVLEATDLCLQDITEIARTDLKVDERPWPKRWFSRS